MLQQKIRDYLGRRFLRICPYGSGQLGRLVTECLAEIVMFSVAAGVLLCFWNSLFPETSLLYFAESVFLAVYLVALEIPAHKILQKENQVYQELLLYFSRVKHRYMACHHIANSVLGAAEGMSCEIQCLAGELYHVLLESDRKDKVREYVSGHHTNRYLKLFLVQAFETSEKGDVLLSGEHSMFSENVEHLRLELMEELYRRKKRAHEFAGYVFVGTAPFFLMPVLKQWGLDFAPELASFYAGTGILLELITAMITVAVYRMIHQAKEIALFEEEEDKLWKMECLYSFPVFMRMQQQLEQGEGKAATMVRRWILMSGEQTTFGRLMLKVFLYAASFYLIFALFCADAHRRERQIILTSTEAIETIAPVASEEKKKVLAAHMLVIVERNKNNPEITEQELLEEWRADIHLGNRSMEQAIVQEIKERIQQYGEAEGSFAEVIFCMVAGASMGMLPLLKLKFRVQAARSGAINEVRMFQSVLIMERHLHGITMMGLLEDMELFARSFKNILGRCLNSYGSGPQAALLALKRDGSRLQKDFEELADAFLSVDEVGIAKAFAEVESNRKLLEKMTRLEEEISMERKRDNAGLLAKVPMLLAVGFYFIVPFFVYALQGVAEIFELLEEIA